MLIECLLYPLYLKDKNIKPKQRGNLLVIWLDYKHRHDYLSQLSKALHITQIGRLSLYVTNRLSMQKLEIAEPTYNRNNSVF